MNAEDLIPKLNGTFSHSITKPHVNPQLLTENGGYIMKAIYSGVKG